MEPKLISILKIKFQFLLVLIHSSTNLVDSDCTFPKGYTIAFISYGIFITLLFLNFYNESYNPNQNKADRKKQ